MRTITRRRVVLPCLVSTLLLLTATAANATSATKSATTAGVMPTITGTPTIDAPQLLDWPTDRPAGNPDITEPTANRALDLHADIADCDMVLSTAGNHHMALRELWYDVYLKDYVPGLRNWYYTTTPPVAQEQIANQILTLSNFTGRCRPQVAVGPAPTMTALQSAGVTDGAPQAIWKNRGNVILVKKGNPRNVRSIWDLGRDSVRVVTPNPTKERNSFENYRDTIYNVAANAPAPPAGQTAEQLFNNVFNNPDKPNKWLAGSRTHHRELPWSVAYGRADAAVIFYHLALDAVRTFPDLFEIVPLGGTAANPQPLPGNRIGQHFAVRINGTWNPTQLNARDQLMNAFASPAFTDILLRNGFTRP